MWGFILAVSVKKDVIAKSPIVSKNTVSVTIVESSAHKLVSVSLVGIVMMKKMILAGMTTKK